MHTEMVLQNGISIAVVRESGLLLTDVHSALELVMDVKYETGCERGWRRFRTCRKDEQA